MKRAIQTIIVIDEEKCSGFPRGRRRYDQRQGPDGERPLVNRPMQIQLLPLRGHVTFIGCKLDDVDFAEKLAQVLLQNGIPLQDGAAHGGVLLRRTHGGGAADTCGLGPRHSASGAHHRRNTPLNMKKRAEGQFFGALFAALALTPP